MGTGRIARHPAVVHFEINFVFNGMGMLKYFKKTGKHECNRKHTTDQTEQPYK